MILYDTRFFFLSASFCRDFCVAELPSRSGETVAQAAIVTCAAAARAFGEVGGDSAVLNWFACLVIYHKAFLFFFPLFFGLYKIQDKLGLQATFGKFA